MQTGFQCKTCGKRFILTWSISILHFELMKYQFDDMKKALLKNQSGMGGMGRPTWFDSIHDSIDIFDSYTKPSCTRPTSKNNSMVHFSCKSKTLPCGLKWFCFYSSVVLPLQSYSVNGYVNLPRYHQVANEFIEIQGHRSVSVWMCISMYLFYNNFSNLQVTSWRKKYGK